MKNTHIRLEYWQMDDGRTVVVFNAALMRHKTRDEN